MTILLSSVELLIGKLNFFYGWTLHFLNRTELTEINNDLLELQSLNFLTNEAVLKQ